MLSALLRHDRTLVLACLVAIIVLSWVWLLTGAGLKMDEMDMGGGQIMLMAPPWTVQDGAMSMIRPPPMSISSILSPAPVINQTHDSTITATRPARTSVRSWRRRALSTTGRTV